LKRLAFFLAFSSLLAGQQNPSAAPHLIIVSIDGLMPSTIRDAEKLGLKIPNLREFRDNGAFAQGLRGVMPTVTYPSHTTMMTGREPAQHGIISNELFDHDQRLDHAWYWYAESIKTPTLWDMARSKGLTTAGVSWPVTVGAHIDFNLPEYRAIATEEQLMLYRSLSTPGLMAEFEKRSGPIAAGEDDKGRARAAAYLIRTRKPNLLLVHIFDLDHEQHAYGPGSPESFRALEGDDACLGMLRQEVAAAGLADSTRWIVVSDHGFLPVQKAFQPHAFLTSLGLSGTEGKAETWRVAAHANGGSVAFVARDPNDTEAQTLVRNTLEKLRQEGTWGIGQVLGRSDLEKLKGYPHAFLAVSLSPGFTSGGNRAGAWVTPSGNTRGMHGYAPGADALDATFLAFGPGISARRLPRGELKDIAKTAATLLGIEVPGAEGRDLLRAGQ
jgi:predicted AlkP superfamily pyrophosphatase or phosphodiesterase